MSDREVLEVIFNELDIDDDKILEFHEIKKRLRDCGFGFTDSEYRAMIDLGDKDGDGCLTVEEFVDIFQRISSIATLTKQFNEYDVDKNGFVTVAEFREVIENKYKRKVNIDKLKRLIEKKDIDGDNRISYYEFLSASL